MGDVGRKVINWLVEIITKNKVDDVGRKVINGLIEINIKSEVSNVGWEVINRLIKFITICEVWATTFVFMTEVMI